MSIRSISRLGLSLAASLACIPEDLPASAGNSSTAGDDECQTDAECPVVCVDGRCVECSANEHCGNPKPICVGEVCQGCSAPNQCQDPTPICVVDDCLPCTSNVECLELGDDVCVLEPGPDHGSCIGCTSSADCPYEYPHCAESQCAFSCSEDPYEPFEPVVLGDHLDGGMISGFVCATDQFDRFRLALPGPAFVSLRLYADPKAGNVDLALIGPDDTVIRLSQGHSGFEAIHTHVSAAGDYEIQVSLDSGPAGAPFELGYRTLQE